jgi:hypothetical protein
VSAPVGPDPSKWKLPRLVIDRDGGWSTDDGEITHGGILDNLRQGLQRDAGGHFLQVGPARIPVEVEDAPYVVVRAEFEGASGTVILNDLTRESLRLDTLAFGPGEIPYCRVKDGAFDARFSRAATWALLQHLERDEASGSTVLVLPGLRQPIPTVERPSASPPGR